MLNTLLSSSTLFSPLAVTGVPSASVIDTPLVEREVDDTAALAVDGDDEVADVDTEVDVDGTAGVADGLDGEGGTVVDVAEILDDAAADLGEELDVSFGVGLLSAAMVSSSDCRTMGNM